jgi:hypothetical protein
MKMYKVHDVFCKTYEHESPTRLDGQDKPGTPTTMHNRCVPRSLITIYLADPTVSISTTLGASMGNSHYRKIRLFRASTLCREQTHDKENFAVSRPVEHTTYL